MAQRPNREAENDLILRCMETIANAAEARERAAEVVADTEAMLAQSRSRRTHTNEELAAWVREALKVRQEDADGQP